jgi:hypothetical protein
MVARVGIAIDNRFTMTLYGDLSRWLVNHSWKRHALLAKLAS